MKNNYQSTIDKKICSACGGSCCKALPGSASPEDFPTKESVISAIESGRWAIDWWEGDARVDHDELSQTYFLRPATKGMEGIKKDPSWGGECTFLTDKGCELSFDDRPKGCRVLKPLESGRCYPIQGWDKQESAIEWIPRSNELSED